MHKKHSLIWQKGNKLRIWVIEKPDPKARTATFNPDPTTLSNFRLKAPTLGAMVAELSRRMKGGLINTNGLCGK